MNIIVTGKQSHNAKNPDTLELQEIVINEEIIEIYKGILKREGV